MSSKSGALTEPLVPLIVIEEQLEASREFDHICV